VVCGLAADSDSVHQAVNSYGHATSLFGVQQSPGMTFYRYWVVAKMLVVNPGTSNSFCNGPEIA